MLIELSRAGARQAVVAVEPRFSLIARADEELARALQAFAADRGAEALQAGGRAVAARVRADELAAPVRELLARPRARALQAARRDVVGFDRPRPAALAIVKDAGKASDGLTSRWLNRPLSRRISAALLQIPGLRPGHLTVLTAAVALTMFITLVLGGRLGLVVGALLFHAASVVDGLDGEVARATFRSSARGALMDTAVDMATNLMFVLGLTLGLARLHDLRDAAAGALGLALWTFGVIALSVLVRLGPRGGSLDVLKIAYARSMTGPVQSALVALARNILGRDFFALAFAVIALAGGAWTIPWLIAGAAGFWLLLIAAAAPMVLRARPGGLQPEHLAPRPGLDPLAYKAGGPRNPLL